MKICVPVEADRGLDSPVSEHFGRAPRFAIADVTSGEVAVHVPAAGHGCGRHAGHLRRLGVDAVVCRGIGRGAMSALREAGIDALIATDLSVRSVLDAVAAGNVAGFEPSNACAKGDHGHGSHGCRPGSNHGTA